LVSLLALAVTVTLLIATPTGAAAEPDEGGGQEKLIQNLEAAARGYLEAQDALEVSKNRQAQLKRELLQINGELVPLRKEVGAIAAAAYTQGRLNTLGALLASHSSDDFLSRATMLEEMTLREDEALNRLLSLEAKAKQNKESIDAEAAIQTAQAAEMKRRIDATELTLSKSGGRYASGWLDPNSPAAIPAPRTKSGGWPREYCSVKDPTGTGGCITPRLLHAYNEARRAKFTKFTKCWRTQSWGEHPKGRACDFSVHSGGFSGTATGNDRVYGDKLASFFIKNARALGVLYVIWYRKIWLPGVGWRSYHGCCGASAEHTNHVHLSMY
jgi:hypothetical protein